jgi:hypothetical protein
MGARIESDDPALGRLFTGFRHTAYRLETALYPAEESAAMGRFGAGEPLTPDPDLDGWTDLVAQAAAAGKVMQRVHLIRPQDTEDPYFLFELAVYELNAAAGEDIRIWVTGSPEDMDCRWDYWLFDSCDLWIMNYGDGGQFQYAEQVTSPSLVVQHAYWRDVALHRATPLSDYLRRVPELRRVS